jgi:hypothetical protein
MELLAVWDSDGGGDVKEDTQRAVFLCRECQKDPERPGYYKDGSIQPHVVTHEEAMEERKEPL